MGNWTIDDLILAYVVAGFVKLLHAFFTFKTPAKK